MVYGIPGNHGTYSLVDLFGNKGIINPFTKFNSIPNAPLCSLLGEKWGYYAQDQFIDLI
jgi:hypothetical protein